MKNRNFIYIFIAIILSIGLESCTHENVIELNSPNKKISVVFSVLNGSPTYKVTYNDNEILNKSHLGLLLADTTFGTDFKLASIKESHFDNTWKPVVGKTSKVRNNYNEYVIKLQEDNGKQREMDIIFRMYDDGIAFRYNIPEQSKKRDFSIEKDLTTFNFPADITWWSANDEHENLGPLSYDSIPKVAKLPFLAKFNDSLWLSIQEAAIYNYSNFYITKNNEENSIKPVMLPSKGSIDKPTSWRVIMLGKTPGSFIETNLLANLNPPNKIKDPSWIVPGKSMWDWRVWGYKAADGFEYGLNTESHIRLVDFASKNNIKYLLIDADWYGPEFEKDSDPSKARKGIDIHKLLKYAKEKNVKVILYLNDVAALKYGLEAILSKFHEWGAAGIKYGFMEGEGQEKVLHTRQVVEMCAKYKLLVNLHDLPIPPSGDTRTWPNLIAREYCHAQADAKRSYWPETAVSAAFINMTTGPLDMTNGWYDLDNAQSRPRVFQPIPGTVAAETAKLLIYSSGLMVLPDAPEEYEKKADLFDFVKYLPDSYDEVKVLGGAPDSYIALARRKGDTWYIGSLTNRNKRTLNLKLDFLDENKKYKAKIFEDAKNTHFLKNKLSYNIRTVEVDNKTTLPLNLAPGGGCSVRIEIID